MSDRLADTTGTLIQAALRLITIQYQPAEHPHEADFAQEKLTVTARELVRAVNGLEPGKQPAQWRKRVPCTVGRTASPEIAPYSEDGEDCGACAEIQDLCRYHQGYANAVADQAKKAA